jgi:hypothetical protein
LVFITEVESVYSAVGTESLYKTDTLRLERVNCTSRYEDVQEGAIKLLAASAVGWQEVRCQSQVLVTSRLEKEDPVTAGHDAEWASDTVVSTWRKIFLLLPAVMHPLDHSLY